MLDYQKIQEAFTGLVGVRQPLDTLLDKLDANHYTSASGLFFDDVEHFRINDIWDLSDFRNADNTQIQTHYNRIYSAAVSNIVDSIFGTVPDFIDEGLLYNFAFDRFETRATSDFSKSVGQFYGVEFWKSQEKNVVACIRKVKLEFKGTGTIKLVLHSHASGNAILKEKTITISSDSTPTEIDLDWYLEGENYRYFIGYYPSEITGDLIPFRRILNNANYMAEYSCIDVLRRIKRTEGFENLRNMQQDNEHNGLNFQVNILNDYTEQIINNKRLFAKALQLQFVISLLMSVISSNRVNPATRLTREVLESITMAVDGIYTTDLKKKGLKSFLKTELEKISKVVLAHKNANNIDQYIRNYVG